MNISNPSFEQHLKKVIAFHFSPETGSPFWLEKRKKFNFDPLKDINNLSDLRLFPDVSEDLKHVDAESLIPRGLLSAEIAGIYESGGTTGKPKKVVAFDEWLNNLVTWRVENVSHSQEEKPLNTLAVVPSGPHIVGEINKRRAKAYGGYYFTVDMDPRWVKKLLHEKQFDVANQYSQHIIKQIEDILSNQDIGYLIATPPLLENIAKNKPLTEKLNRTLKVITWGGTQMDPDTLDYLKEHVFPDVEFNASYGSTMILGEARARMGEEYQDNPIFDSFSPNVLFEVIDVEKAENTVEYGSRGRVLMHHLTRYAFLPNILERDTAIRLPRNDGLVGDAVAMVEPLQEVGGVEVIEGVY
ncbi:hypothetical protein [Vibrio sp. vnigr-6D03]|uniref:hypothetical protein n=1 Tax=Vibrio sp. vnigr-6D03 TaxID=2058088 RepID=UPI00191C7788|nr:hypothetical protein [Vibrio sp. vnigr-6D03]